MTSYVKDTLPAAWVEGEVYLWHRIEGVSFTDDGSPPGNCRMADVFLARCGRRVTTQDMTRVIHREMTLSDWIDRFGDDWDLCECAVSQADAARVAGAIREKSK